MANHNPTTGGHNKGADQSQNQSAGSHGANPLDQSLTNGQTDYDADPFAVPNANMPSPSTAAEPSSVPVTTELNPTPGDIDLAAASLSEPPHAPTPEPAAIPSPEPTPSTTVAAGAEGEVPKNANNEPVSETSSSPSSTTPTAEDFRKEMEWERHGYRPVAYFRTVEEARSSGRDLDKFETYVSVKESGFTKEELAALPSDAKQKNYYIGFAKQLLDSSEGIFTKKFWTSFEGIKKVLTAGIIKGEVEGVDLGAAEWLLSKRSGVAQAAAASPEESGATEAASTPTPHTEPTTPAPDAPVAPETESVAPVTEPLRLGGPTGDSPVVESEIVETPPAPTQETPSRAADAPIIDIEAEVIEAPAATTDKKKQAIETKTLEIAALQEIERRVQEKLETLRGRIVPETITVRFDDKEALETVAQIQRYGAGFSTGFDAQIKKVNDAFEAIGKIDLVKPQSAIEFKKGQGKALEKIDALSFGKDNVEAIAKNVDGGLEKLPHSMREAITKSDDILEQIKNDLGEARRLIGTARRANLQSTESKGEVKTGLVAEMPKLKDLTTDPRKLVAMGHAMVDGVISDKDLKESYRQVMSDFVRSYVTNFSNIRKEIYQPRMDGKEMNELQKERLRYLAEVLGTETKVSDLYKLSSSREAELDESFMRFMDNSPFQKALNKMKSEFATALTKELDKKPGIEDNATTYVAFKRERYEKTEGFKKHEKAEKIIIESRKKQDLTAWLSSYNQEELRNVREWDSLTPDEIEAVDGAIKIRQANHAKGVERTAARRSQEENQH